MEDFDNNWKEHIENVNQKMINMWNYMIYNEFSNEQYKLLEEKYENLKFDYNYIQKKYHNVNKKYNDFINKESKKRKLDTTNSWYNNEINSIPKKLKQENNDINNNLLDVFNDLNSINDIINLKNNIYKYELLNSNNSKFKQIYKLIPSLEKLNELIGMNNVKQYIYKIICYFIHGLNNPTEINHIVITGNPGVGKTTLGKLIGNIYLNLGFLKNNKFILAKRADLIGKYLGQTAPKTQEMIDKAEGGILFIDEVYSLGNKETKDSYAKECIDTINQNLTEKSDKFLCIIAGYEDDVEKCFFSYNKGLERRFSIKFNIKNYNSEELLDIFKLFVKKESWLLEDNSINLNDLEKIKDCIKYNGGDMQKIFQKAKENYSIRAMNNSLDMSNKKILIRNDILHSLEQFKPNEEIDNYYKYALYT